MQDTVIMQTIDVPAKNAALSSIERIEQLQEEIKNLEEMQASVLENDPDYDNALAARKQASENLKQIKSKLLNQNTELIERRMQIVELRQEIKEVKSEVGYQLGLFQQQTGQSVLESNSGKRYHIVNTYKKAKSE